MCVLSFVVMDSSIPQKHVKMATPVTVMDARVIAPVLRQAGFEVVDQHLAKILEQNVQQATTRIVQPTPLLE